jgi:hypothetical protein
MNQIVEDLKEARRLIVECGWITGHMRCGGCYCLDGAVAEATGYPLMDCLVLYPKPGTEVYNNHEDAYRHLHTNQRAIDCLWALRSALDSSYRHRTGTPASTIYSWNDRQPNRQPVVDLLDRTIKAIRE